MTIIPMLRNGTLYHIGLKTGQASNLVVMVGIEPRARTIARAMTNVTDIKSDRGYVTLTGLYRGYRISIICIGMGFPLMDIALRELRAVVAPGPMVIIRVGTCGIIKKEVAEPVGRLAVTDHGAVLIQRNYDSYSNHPNMPDNQFYHISLRWMADPELSAILKRKTQERMGVNNVLSSLDASADSFYSSQGRTSPGFADNNGFITQTLIELYPDAPNITMEMETGQLIYSACAMTDESNKIYAAAMHIVAADRIEDSFLGDIKKRLEIESQIAEPVLDAIVEFAQTKHLRTGI